MNEAELRDWVREIIAVIRKGCLLTPTVIDENVADMVLRAVDNDLLWGWMYRLISNVLGPDEDDPILVTAEALPVDAVEAEAINPLVVIAVIKALIDLWKQFRD